MIALPFLIALTESVKLLTENGYICHFSILKDYDYFVIDNGKHRISKKDNEFYQIYGVHYTASDLIKFANTLKKVEG